MKSQNYQILIACLMAASAISTGLLHADVKPNALFTDGAVLQRGQAVPVWGTANDGEKVSVEINGQKVETTAQGGKWSVSLKPLEAGGPFTLAVSGDNTVKVNNLLVGEVWVCSGQSNMEWKFSGTSSANEERPKAKFPEIRMFTVTKKVAVNPQAEVAGSWVECSPETVNGFSAVGYFFARDLYQKLGVPVGMIHTSWGGTPAQAWTSAEGFEGHDELKGYLDTAKAIQAQDPEKPDGKTNQNTASTLYNGMLAPLVPYAIKGAIWYQGESNSGRAKEYQTLFPAMIADWRAKWNQGDFPFYFVQIAPHKGMSPEIREAQLLTLSKSKNTAMAVITDVGNLEDIHPRQKEPVGQRLAYAARALVYGEKIEYSGPHYESMKVAGDKVQLTFSHVGGGLKAKDGELKGFTVAGSDGKFVPAKAEIKGDTIVLSGEGVADPKAVRYGWANFPEVNLFNMEGIPASPFRTDVD